MNLQGPLWRFTGVRPTAWLFFAFLYVPILVLVALSFNGGQSATIWESFSLKWYAVVANDPEIVRAAKNSLLVATFATLIATALATLAALGMRGRAFHGQIAMSGVLGLPLLVPEIVTAVATLMFFAFVGLKLSLFTILIAHVVFCIPFAYLPIRARLEGMDPRLAEAAADLYASPWKAFWKITFPLLTPGILSGRCSPSSFPWTISSSPTSSPGPARPPCRCTSSAPSGWAYRRRSTRFPRSSW